MSKASRIYAWGEIKDHKRAYGVIIAVIALTMASFMLINASQLYMTQVVSSTTKMTLSSDACILAPGSDQRDLYGGAGELKNAQKIADQIERELPGYKASMRMTIQGTYNVGDGFDGCTIQGIDLEKDPQLETIKNCMVKGEGEWFDPTKDYLHHHLGTRIDLGNLTEKINIGEMKLGRISFDLSDPSDEPYPIVIGVTATKVHPIKVGDVLTLTATKGGEKATEGTQAFTAAAAMLKVKVIGLYESAVPTLDQMVWFMPVDCMREIKGYGELDPDNIASEGSASLIHRLSRVVNIPLIKTGVNFVLSQVGDATSEDISTTLDQVARGLDEAMADFNIDQNRGEIVIVKAPEPPTHLNDVGYSKKVVKDLQGVIEPMDGDYKIFSFHDFIRYVSGSMQEISTIMNWGMMAIILILAAFAIYHIMDSIVVRKTREIGSLKAFGARDRVVLMIFLYQAFFIGALAGALGIGIGIGTMHLVNWWGGLSIGFIGGTELNIGFLTPWYVVLINFLLPIGVAIGASLIPADRAARLSPVEALRKGEIGL
jgi:ABC-type lipoprotein release transport system permease subunit